MHITQNHPKWAVFYYKQSPCFPKRQRFTGGPSASRKKRSFDEFPSYGQSSGDFYDYGQAIGQMVRMVLSLSNKLMIL